MAGPIGNVPPPLPLVLPVHSPELLDPVRLEDIRVTGVRDLGLFLNTECFTKGHCKFS